MGILLEKRNIYIDDSSGLRQRKCVPAHAVLPVNTAASGYHDRLPATDARTGAFR